MQNGGRGTAIAFLLVMLIICAGVYWVAQSVRTAGVWGIGSAEVITPTPHIAPPTFTPFSVRPTPSPTSSPTLQSALLTPTAQPPIVAAIPTFAPTALPPTPLPPLVPVFFNTPTPRPTAPPPPTATPTFPFQVALQTPDFERGCAGYYIYGYVYDRNGNPLPGVRVHVFDIYGNDIPPVVTKTEPPGWYDVVISNQRDTWIVEVVDEAGRQLSPRVQVLNTGNFVEGQEACWHRVDFRQSR